MTAAPILMKKRFYIFASAYAGLFSLAVALRPATAPATNTAPVTSPGAPIIAPVDASVGVPKTGNKLFFELHESFLARGKAGPIGVLFLGDSITYLWRQAPHIWDHYFGKYQPANFGIGGDQTQHVIWRIENGELDGIQPKVVVLMIGTNNAHSNTGEQVADAVKKIVDLTRAKIPGVKVLLLAILPRGARRNADGLITDAAAADAASRVAVNDRANTLLAKLDDGVHVRFLNTNAIFLGRDGMIPWTIMPDQLHPAAAGYQLWAEALEKPLAEMMK